MNTIKTLSKNVENLSDFICQCENYYNSQLIRLSDEIIRNKVKIVNLCGPTCSGKTTTSHKLAALLESKDRDCVVISFDDFYKNRAQIIRECETKGIPVEYESASTLDLNYLRSVLVDMQGSKSFRTPIYDFNQGIRIGYNNRDNGESTIFILEGIQALYPEIEDCFMFPGDIYKIFIDVKYDDFGIDLPIDNSDVRFVRRIVRDSRHRNTTAFDTFVLWKSVRENEIRNIYPNLKGISFKINSFLLYEFNVLKPYLRSTSGLTECSESDYKNYLKIITDIYETVDAIPASEVPLGSVLREFID